MDFARDDTQEAVAEVAVGLLARGLGPDELWLKVKNKKKKTTKN